MVFGVFHMCHVLGLDMVSYDNDYSTPALHGVFNIDQKVVMA